MTRFVGFSKISLLLKQNGDTIIPILTQFSLPIHVRATKNLP